MKKNHSTQKSRKSFHTENVENHSMQKNIVVLQLVAKVIHKLVKTKHLAIFCEKNHQSFQ